MIGLKKLIAGGSLCSARLIDVAEDIDRSRQVLSQICR